MTTFKVRVLEDGTRLYSNGYKYKPVSEEDRKYKVRKPDDPRAVRFRGDWFIPRDLLEETMRIMPLTRPDSETSETKGLKKKRKKRKNS
jgi:hypothetical protein